MNLAEARIPIMLDKERMMIFNANTMEKFEQATGSFFMDTVAKIYEAMKPYLDQARERQKENHTKELMINSFEMSRKISMSSLTALVWAAVHEYDEKDEPHWPLTLSQVRRYINTTTVPQVFMKFLQGQIENTPTKEEMGESPALATGHQQNANAEPPVLKDLEHGGERSIALPEDAFA